MSRQVCLRLTGKVEDIIGSVKKKLQDPMIVIADRRQKIADFFNFISQEYTLPLERPEPDAASTSKKMEPYEISGRLKAIKKPKGLLNGDINPRLSVMCCYALAFPLSYILIWCVKLPTCLNFGNQKGLLSYQWTTLLDRSGS